MIDDSPIVPSEHRKKLKAKIRKLGVLKSNFKCRLRDKKVSVKETLKETKKKIAENNKKVREVEKRKCTDALLDTRLPKRLLREPSYTCGMFSYSVMYVFARKNKLSPMCLSLLIIMSMVEKLSPFGTLKFGFKGDWRVYDNMNKLVDMGYSLKMKEVPLSNYTGKRMPKSLKMTFFAITIKGRNLIKSYETFFKASRKELMKSEDYKRANTKKWYN